MTSQLFHLVMLLIVGAMSVVSWCGYMHEPHERRIALKWNAVTAIWFLYLFWGEVPAFIEDSYVREGFFVMSLALAINARRLLLGAEFLFTKHRAAGAISTALRARRPIDAAITARLYDRSSEFLIPGLRTFLHRRKAEEARALREKVNADILLAEAIMRRERAWEEAEVMRARRRLAPDAWRAALSPRAGQRR